MLCVKYKIRIKRNVEHAINVFCGIENKVGEIAGKPALVQFTRFDRKWLEFRTLNRNAYQKVFDPYANEWQFVQIYETADIKYALKDLIKRCR